MKPQDAVVETMGVDAKDALEKLSLDVETGKKEQR